MPFKRERGCGRETREKGVRERRRRRGELKRGRRRRRKEKIGGKRERRREKERERNLFSENCLALNNLKLTGVVVLHVGDHCLHSSTVKEEEENMKKK